MPMVHCANGPPCLDLCASLIMCLLWMQRSPLDQKCPFIFAHTTRGINVHASLCQWATMFGYVCNPNAGGTPPLLNNMLLDLAESMCTWLVKGCGTEQHAYLILDYTIMHSGSQARGEDHVPSEWAW